MTFRGSFVAIFVIAATSIFAPLTSAQDVWTTQVRRQLQVIASQIDSRVDYTPSHEPFIGSLNHNTYTEIEYNLQAGVEYVFVGVCDSDCSDLDLKLYDGYHNFIMKDTGEDDKPVVSVKVGRSGRFYLRVIMANCHNSPCRYGTQAFKPAD